MNWLLRRFVGDDIRAAGAVRVWRGIRRGDRNEMYMGAALAAYSWYRSRNGGGRELIYRKKLPEGTALMIHNRKRGAPRIEVVKPSRTDQTR